MSENTGIRIETVREITDNGEVGFRVLSVAALPQDKLPVMYLDSDKKSIVYLDSAGDLGFRTRNEGTYWICLNNFYTTIEMEKRLAHIREAGRHLTDTNNYLRKERESWHGPVLFVDGVQVNDKEKSTNFGSPEPLTERIPRLWAEGKLYYRDNKGKFRKI